MLYHIQWLGFLCGQLWHFTIAQLLEDKEAANVSLRQTLQGKCKQDTKVIHSMDYAPIVRASTYLAMYYIPPIEVNCILNE